MTMDHNESYIPLPIMTSEIELSDDLLELMEILAKNAHDNWAKARFAEGWCYGTFRDDTAKTHPCLIPYERLPESEKHYDRLAAMETLRVIIKIGFRIIKD